MHKAHVAIVFAAALFILAPASHAEQLSPRLSGAINNVVETSDYFVIAGSDIIYLFSKNGTLDKFLTVNEISDFKVSGGRLIVTSYSEDFPNVRAYKFPSLEPEWTFRPKMDVFDQYLVWHAIQPRSWCAKIIDGQIGVCSGYSFYLLDSGGKVANSFTAENDIWDVTSYNGKYYLASQTGEVYTLDGSLNLVEKKKICEDFSLIDPITNNTKGTFRRSVWQIEPNNGRFYAACEDGSIHLAGDGIYPLDGGDKKIEVAKYPESTLYAYYLKDGRQTGFGSAYFRNLKLSETGGAMLAYTADAIGVVKGDTLLWAQDVKPIGEPCVHNGNVYVPKKYANKKETIYVYSLESGEKTGEILVDSLPAQAGVKLFCYGNGFISASPSEIKFADYLGNVSWHYSRIGMLEPVVAGDTLILLADSRESMMDKHVIYYVQAVKGDRILWEYAPKTGYINDAKISGGRIALSISANGDKNTNADGRLVLIEIGTGKILFDSPPTNRTYVGVLDNYLLDETIINVTKNFTYGGVDYGTFYLDALTNGVLDKTTLWNLGTVNVKNIGQLMLRRSIQKVDMCDLNDDGVDDILVSTQDYLVLLDGKTLREEWMADSQSWRYDDEFNKPYKSDFVKPWYENSGVAMCAGDANGDGSQDILIYSYGGYKLLLRSNGTYVEKYSEKLENIQQDSVRLIDDVNSDGHMDLFMANWNENAPQTVRIIDATNGKEITRFQSNGRDVYIRPRLYDANGDGKEETALLYDLDGAIVRLVSGNYDWEYKGTSDYWEVWKNYRYMLPVESYGGRLILGIKNRNDDGIKILKMDVGANKVSEMIDVEQSRYSYDPREWIYAVDMVRDGDVIYMATPPSYKDGGRGKMVAYDMKEGKVKATLYGNVRRTILLGDSIVYLTADGKIIPHKISENLEAGVNAGDYADISWNREGHARVFVNDVLSASVNGKGVRLRLSNGDHEIKVALLDEDNFEEYAYARADVFNATSLFMLNIILAILIAIAAGAKLWMKR